MSAGLWQTQLNHNGDLVLHICRTMADMTESQCWLGATHLQNYGRQDWNHSGNLGSSIPWSHSQLWQFYVRQQEMGTEKLFLADATGLSKALRQPQGIHNMGPEIHETKAERNSHIADIFYCDTEQLFHQRCLFAKKTHVLPFPPWMKPKVNKIGWGEVDLTFPWNTAAHAKRQHSSPSNKPYISNYILWPLPFQEARRSPTTFQQPMYNTSMVHQTCSCNGMRVSKALQHTTNWLWQMTGTRKKKGRVQVTGAPCRWWRWFHSPPCPPLPRGSGCRPTRQTCTQKARQTGLINLSPGERMLHPQKSDSAHAFQRLNC